MRRFLVVIICCFVVATAYIAYVIAERQITLRKFARYNDSWAISQMLSEYMRLEHRLSAHVLGMTGVDYDELRLRIDIMLNRLGLLQQGSLHIFIENDPQRRELIVKLRDILEVLDQQLEALKPEEIKTILQAMNDLDPSMTALASAAVELDVSQLDAALNELRQLHWIYTGLAAGLILCGLGLVIMLFRHNSLLGRAHQRMQYLTDGIREASDELQSQNLRLAHVAHHDALTGLPNRILFRQDLEERLALTATQGRSVVMLLLDLDGFKEVNDTLGHDTGDALLQAVASRLTGLCREGELICRLGGDEFAVLTAGLTEEQAYDFACYVISKISPPYNIDGREIKIGTCIGIAISKVNLDNEELYKQADLALYEAKALGPLHVCIFQKRMQSSLKEKKSFEADLQQALQNGEITVFYQPQVNMLTREICGYEALVRWFHPLRGEVPPAEFVPVAEKIGFMHILGEWVLRTACLEAKQWPKSLKVAVNLSPIQFRSSNLLQIIVSVLKDTSFNPARLELEITESILLEKNEHTLQILSELKAYGIQIAMDDFGTGYSSLASLRGFPFDKIKIDRSFIRDITARADALAIVELVTGIGRSLGMITIAEGIETEEQFECLRQVGCDQGQGYLLGKPMPAQELQHLHNSHSSDKARSYAGKDEISDISHGNINLK